MIHSKDQDPTASATLEQVYFIGDSRDVGGARPDKSLSDIALSWMLEQAESQGLELIPGTQDALRPNPLGPLGGQ